LGTTTQIDDKIRELNAYNRGLIEASLDPLVTIDSDGKISDVNKATELVTEANREELLGTDFSQYFTEREKAERGYQEAFSKGFVKDYPLAIRGKSGRVTDVLYNATVYRNETGEIQGVFAAARDVTERKHMEEELRQSSLYVRSLIEASLDPLVTIDKEGRITDVNQATEQVTGVTREKLIGSDFSNYFTEPEKAEEGYKQVFAQGFVRDYPLAIQHASGKVTDVLYHATVFKNEVGEVQGVFAAARDVTERRRLEEQLRRYSQHLEELVEEKTWELRDSEEKFRTIYEESPIGVEIRDSNGQFLGVNKAWTEIFGISDLSASRESIFQNLNLPNELRLFKGEAWKQEITFDFDEMKKSGLIESARSGICYLDVSAIPISIKDKKSPLGYMIWYENITERKRAEETLALRAGLLSRVHDAVLAIDPSFNIIYWNDAAEEMFGWTEKEVLGKNSREVLQAKIEGSSREEAIDRLLRDGHYEGEIHYQRMDGTYILTDARSAALRGPRGEIQGFVTSIRDITERKKMETLRDQFISAVTHELRTPLVSIKGYTDYLLTGKIAQLPEKVTRSLAVVKDQSDRLLRMTNDLLDYRRLTTGKFELELKCIDLKHVVATSVVETQGLVAAKKQNLQLEIAKEPAEINGDYSRLVQVVSNLIVNASKFSPENGKIILTLSKDEGMWKVSVSDNGIGIKSDDLTRIFEPFAAIVKPTYVKGTGLGLSVSKGLVEAHRGRIWAESAGEEKGSTFTFTVPTRKT